MYLLFTCRFLHSRLFFFQNSCRFTRRRSTLLVVITHIHSTHKFHDVYLDVLSARLNLLLVQRVYAFRAERNAENQSWKTVLACWTLYYLPALERFSRIGPKPYLFYFIFPGQIVNDWRGKKKKKILSKYGIPSSKELLRFDVTYSKSHRRVMFTTYF